MSVTDPFHYFTRGVNREVKEIYWQTFFANFALALVFIFEPIYLYILSHSYIHILWFYVQIYGWYVLLVVLGAKFASKFGYKHSIVISNLFYIVYWILLYFIRVNPTFFFIAPIFFALQKSFYWPAYDADISLNDVKIQRGREIGVLMSTGEIAFILAPFLGGLITASFGFLPLFVLAAVLMFFSTLPLFQSPDIFTRHQFRLKNLWQILKNNPRNFLSYWGYAEDLAVMSIWPVYIFTVVPYFGGVGLLTAIAMLIATVLMLYVGKQSDRTSKHFLIERNSVFYGISWLVRFVATSVPMVLLFDVLTKTLKGLVVVPVVAQTYELAGEKGPDYAIAFSVFYEFSVGIGKFVAALGAIVILIYTKNIFVVFAWIGLLTIFYSLLKGSRK